MKISEMNNEQATKALIRLAEPISNICDDEDAVKLFDEVKDWDKGSILRAVGKMIPKVVTYALKKHKNDLYEIVGALTDKTAIQVSEMRFVETVKVVRESYDEVLAGFFTRSEKQISNSESK